MQQNNDATREIKVWDLPTRLFHWSLVILFAISWASTELFDNFDIHAYSGYAILVLVLFRVLWGIFGSTTARFTNFVRGLRPTLDYVATILQPKPSNQIGHNPLGGWTVLFMLGLLLFQAGTGLFSNDDMIDKGPLVHWISTDLSDILSELHEEAFNFLLALVGLHIVAVLFYRFFKRENLITPMITGNKSVSDKTTPALRFTSPWIALLLLGIVVAGFMLLITQA